MQLLCTLPRIGLITILTDNVEGMKRFYGEVIGFDVKEDLGNYVEFSSSGVRFALYQRAEMLNATGETSYGEMPKGHRFELAIPAGSPEDVERLYADVVAKGARPVKPPKMMPWGRSTAFIADPDGNIHELYSLKPGEEI